jgi:2'-5' RNA ligase
MGEFVAAHILDEYEVGDRFSTWPLHVTILPPFQADTVGEVKLTISEIVSTTAPIPAQLGEFAKFGEKRIAQKIITNPELASLHNKLLQVANMQGWGMDARYLGDYYTPHVTRKLGRDYKGTSFIVDKLVIVASLGQGYRQIVDELPLGLKK